MVDCAARGQVRWPALSRRDGAAPDRGAVILGSLTTTALTSVSRVLAKLEPGGAQLSVLRVMQGLEAHGLRSRLFVGWACPEGLALARRMNVEVEVYGGGGDLQWRADPGFVAWLRPRLAGAAVVHAHMFGAWWAAAHAVDADTALVASEHNELTWPNGHPAASLAPGLARVDLFYAHGPGARRGVLAAGLPPARVRDGVSPVVDLEAEPRTGLPSPRIVFAGRLHPDKAPDVLLDALARLPHAPPALILGAGPLREMLARRIAAWGIADRVALCGWQDRPGPYIAGASVLVVPSREEAWSQTAVLGMALGVPVVGTDVDGLPDTLAGGRGIVVAPEDPVGLASAIDDVLGGHRRTNLQAARRYAHTFTVARVAARYASAYRELHDMQRSDDTPLTAEAS